MKIYFTASVSQATDETKSHYEYIIRTLTEMGHAVIADHVLGKDKEDLTAQSVDEALDVQKQMSQWKKTADLVVVEATTPSFGVGQEIAEALNNNKQVLVLYSPGKKPHILINHGKDVIYFAEYTKETLSAVLDEYIEYAKTNTDTRFNFFISPQIGSYLDWVSRKRKLPRAVYLRKLIEDDMDGNREYTNSTE